MQALKSGANPDRMATVMIERTIKRGYPAFRAMADELRRMHRARNKQGKVVILAGRANNIAIMEELADEWDIDFEWMFYG